MAFYCKRLNFEGFVVSGKISAGFKTKLIGILGTFIVSLKVSEDI